MDRLHRASGWFMAERYHRQHLSFEKKRYILSFRSRRDLFRSYESSVQFTSIGNESLDTWREEESLSFTDGRDPSSLFVFLLYLVEGEAIRWTRRFVRAHRQNERKRILLRLNSYSRSWPGNENNYISDRIQRLITIAPLSRDRSPSSATIFETNSYNQLSFLPDIDVGTSSPYKLKIFAITGDYPVLKSILKFVGHGGYWCCWMCYLKGVHDNGKRQYRYEASIEYRSTRVYSKQSSQAEQEGCSIFGHHGVSPLHAILDNPLPRSIIIDYLHATLLGHGKRMILTTSNVHRCPIHFTLDFGSRKDFLGSFFWADANIQTDI